MRVADHQLFGVLLGNLQRSRGRILDAQTQISSQKRVTRPSDDPSSFGQIVLDKSALSQVRQTIRNIHIGTGRLQVADSTLSQVQNVLTRIRELTVQARSDTTSAAGRMTIAQEVRQLHRQLVALANAESAGEAVFAGTKTDVTPFVVTTGDTVVYQGNAEPQSLLVGPNQTTQVLVPGSDVFTGPTTNIFDTVRDLLLALETDNGPGIEVQLGNLESATQQISQAQGHIGGLANRLETTKAALESLTETVTRAISGNEDVDLASAISDLRRHEVALEAAGEAFTRIFENSLLRFLR